MGNWNNIHHADRPSHKVMDHIPQSISLAGQLICLPTDTSCCHFCTSGMHLYQPQWSYNNTVPYMMKQICP